MLEMTIKNMMRTMRTMSTMYNEYNEDNEDNEDDDETDQHWWISLLLRVFPKRKVMYWIVTSSPAAMST